MSGRPQHYLPTLGLGVLLALVSASPSWGQGARREDGVTEAPAPQPTLTSPPVLLQGVAPEYPPEAMAAGKEAEVKVRIHIDEAGVVTNVEILEPVGDGFDEAATAAAEQYLFKPAEFDGKPGPIVVETSIHFTIERVEEPAPAPESPREMGGSADTTEPDGPLSHAGPQKKPVTVQGVALERGNRRKLAGIIVSIVELKLDAVTDEDGRFYFHGVPPGGYSIVAVDQRYERFTRPFDLASGEQLDVSLYLRTVGGNPYESVVEGQREVLEVTRRRLERQQLTSVPGTFGDPIRVIQTLPGLARTPFSTGFLLIRGSNPDDSGVYIDGHRVPLLFHFLGGPSVLSADFLDGIDLYPGGYPARFGRVIGGIVSVDTRPAKSDGIHGSADIDFLDSSAYVRFPVHKNGAIALAGRRSYVDNFVGFFLPDQEPGATLIVVPIYYDYQGRLDWDFGGDGKASIFALGSGDRLDVLSRDSDEEQSLDLNTTVDFFRVIGSYSRPLWGRLKLTLSPAFGRDGFSASGGQEDQAAFTGIDVSVTTLGYRMRATGPIGDRFVLDTGFDIESRVTQYNLMIPLNNDFEGRGGRVDIPPEQLERNVDILSYGWHADLAIDIARLRLIPGIRLDGHLIAGTGQFAVDPRLVARYRATKEWTLKGYGGLFHQPPQPEALDREFGNPDVTVERAVHTGAGFEWRFADNWFVDAEGYYIKRYNQVRFSDDAMVDAAEGTVDTVNFANTGDGYTYGIEVLLKREITQSFYGWLSYTLSFTKDRSNPDEPFYFTPFDQRHNLNAVASYRFKRDWELGARFRVSTGSPDTPILGGTFDADANRYSPVEGDIRSARKKTFQQLDVRAEKTWVFETWRLGVYLDIQNLLNASNEEATEYDYRYRDTAPVQSVPFLPTLGIKGQF